MKYTLADPAEAYKQAFAAFSGAKWLGEGQYRQSEEVLAAAQALGEKAGLSAALITQRDVDTIAAEVTQRCMAAGVTPAEIAKLVGKLGSNVGASKASLDEIRGEAMRDAESLATEASGKSAESAEEHRERLREEIRRIDESLDEQYKRMVATGQMSQATYDNWKRSTGYAAAHPEDAQAQTAAQAATEKAQTEAEGNAKTPEEIAAVNGTRPLVEQRGEYVEQQAALEQPTEVEHGKEVGESAAPSTGEIQAPSVFRAPSPVAEVTPAPSEAPVVLAYADVTAPAGPQANLPNVAAEPARGGVGDY